MFDEEFIQYARELLEAAVELKVAGFVQFAQLAAKVFPSYFEAVGFPRAEAESMTVQSIKRIETSLSDYAAHGGQDLRQWLSEQLNRTIRKAVKDLQTAARELAAASQRQAEIFQLVDIEGAEVRVKYRPALAISGDFTSALRCADGSYLIVMGDAKGKGGEAAYYAVLALGFLYAKSMDVSDPAEVIRLLNRGLMSRPVEGASVTLTLARWNPKNRELSLSNAAGCFPIRVTDAGPEEVKLCGQWLGQFETVDPDSTRYIAAGRELLVMYSDGVVDQQEDDASNERYGFERLRSVLQRCYELPVDQLIDQVFNDLDQFRAETPLSDDQTVLVARFV